jgi:hypothetical protein
MEYYNICFQGAVTKLLEPEPNQVQGKRKESVTLCCPLTLLACLVEVSRVSTADSISLVMKRSLFRSSTKKGIVTTTKFAR